MRTSFAPAARRGLFGLLAACLLTAVAPAGQGIAHPGGPGPGAGGTGSGAAQRPVTAKPVTAEADRIPFSERYSVVQHGGLVRTADAAISCRTSVGAACTEARAGSGDNHDFDMFYADVDADPNTYNSTRAELSLPAGATVTYARLYWGGNLHVGEQKPPADDGRVLVAEPGGAYKEVLADTEIGHRTTEDYDVYHASANVTDLVRTAGPGLWTVAQANVAMGRSPVGAFGGWTLVVAYEKPDAPLRRLSLWDGFETLDAQRRAMRAELGGMDLAKGAQGRLGVVAYDGDRGISGDSITAGTEKGAAVTLSNATNKADDVMNSSITDSGVDRIKRQPAYPNNLGYDSDVFDLGSALTAGGNRLAVRFDTGRDSLWLGAFFVEAAARD